MPCLTDPSRCHTCGAALDLATAGHALCLTHDARVRTCAACDAHIADAAEYGCEYHATVTDCWLEYRDARSEDELYGPQATAMAADA